MVSVGQEFPSGSADVLPQNLSRAVVTILARTVVPLGLDWGGPLSRLTHDAGWAESPRFSLAAGWRH